MTKQTKVAAKPRAKKATKKPTKKVVAKKVTKASAKKKTTKRAKGGSTKSRGKAKPKSVDGVLLAYEKERVVRQSNLESLTKKINDLVKKTEAYKIQIEKLSAEKDETVKIIAELDQRRDAEVAEVLSSLGINVGMMSKPVEDRPLFDNVETVHTSGEEKDSDGEQAASAKDSSEENESK